MLCCTKLVFAAGGEHGGYRPIRLRWECRRRLARSLKLGAIRVALHKRAALFLAALSLAAAIYSCSLGAIAGINRQCLNTDAAAQTRLIGYERAQLAPQAPSVDAQFASESVSITQPHANALTARTPYEIPKEVLLDWTKWPTTDVKYAGRSFAFMAVHVTDKDANTTPCIRLVFRIMAPDVESRAGLPYLVSRWESAHPRLKSIAEAVTATVTWDGSEQFYVIDLARLRSEPYWQKRYAIYQKNVRAANSPNAYPVHFERFIFNVVRGTRYSAPSLSPEERERFKRATSERLKDKGFDCVAHPQLDVCILNAVFMKTELGAANPLSVTDALDNSGLAFGPRQLDLGQGRKDATAFAKTRLIERSNPEEVDWEKRFFQPVEAMTVRDLRTLYGTAARTFNDRLALASDDVIDLYVSGISEMVSTDYKLKQVAFSGSGALLAQLLAADFSNKWGANSTPTIVNYLKTRQQPLDECNVLNAWKDGVQKYFGPADVEDFIRRSHHVAEAYSVAMQTSLKSCGY